MMAGKAYRIAKRDIKTGQVFEEHTPVVLDFADEQAKRDYVFSLDLEYSRYEHWLVVLEADKGG